MYSSFLTLRTAFHYSMSFIEEQTKGMTPSILVLSQISGPCCKYIHEYLVKIGIDPLMKMHKLSVGCGSHLNDPPLPPPFPQVIDGTAVSKEPLSLCVSADVYTCIPSICVCGRVCRLFCV